LEKTRFQLLAPGAREKFRTLIDNLTSKLVEIDAANYLPSMQSYA
jgi:hypothetical protein